MRNEVLEQIRLDADLSQAEFAERLGWTQGYVSLLEAGERGVFRHVILIRDEFKTEMKRLGFGLEDLIRGTLRRRR